ncbi:hypothetical protein D3C85_541470 [compost metagenome]|jgi:hypothetical protein
MNILFLQPRDYFEELIELKHLPSSSKLTFGYSPLWPIKRILSNYDIVFSCIDHDKEARKICRIAKALGLEVVFLQDGIFDFSNSFENKLLKAKKTSLLSKDCYTQIFFTDLSAFEYFKPFNAELKLYWPIRMLSHNPATPTTTSSPLFLITAANNPIFNQAEFPRLIKLIKNLEAQLEILDIPYNYRIFDKSIIEALKIRPERNMTSGSFEDCVTSGYTAVFSTPSSIINTTANYGIPAIVFDYRSAPILSVAGWRIHESVDLSEEIASIILQSPSRMDYQRRMLPIQSIPEIRQRASTCENINHFELSGFMFIKRLIYKKYFSKKIKLKSILFFFLNRIKR